MTRKIFIIITLFVLLAGLVTIILSKKSTPNEVATENNWSLPKLGGGLPNLQSLLNNNSNPSQVIKNLTKTATSTFYQVSDLDVAPQTTVIDSGSTTVIFFADQKTGQVYLKTKYGEPQRLTTDILRNISDLKAILLPRNKVRLFIRHTDNQISFYSSTLIDINSTSTNSWVSLPKEVINLEIAPNYSQIAYTKIIGGHLLLYTNTPDLSTEKVVWSSPYVSWLISYYNQDKFLAQSKSDSDQIGLSLIIDPNSKSVVSEERLLGLTVWAGKNTAYHINTFVDNRRLQSRLINDFNQKLTTDSNQPLFTDLCAESLQPNFIYCATPRTPVSDYPTAWYKGKENYSFKIIAINPNNNQTEDLFLPNNNNFDNLSSLNVNSRNTTLYFTKNNKLWQYDLLP